MLAVDDTALFGMAAVATITLPVLALIWRPLILESLDPGFMAATGGRGGVWHLAFLALVVLCVVRGFVALGTLMSVGLMMLPAIAARHWSVSLGGQVGASVALAVAGVGRRVAGVIQRGRTGRSGNRADRRGALDCQPDRRPLRQRSAPARGRLGC